MAKNYTFEEAVKAIHEGDMETIQDMGRRFPVLTAKVAAVVALAGEQFVDLVSFMPEYLTANKVNKGIKDALANADEIDEGSDEVDDETSEESETDYESMSAKELWDILGKAGKRNTAKSKKKADLIAAVIAMGNAEAEESGEEEEELESGNKYEGKTAMELFKECKARGIKAAAKKPAKHYESLLLKADAENDASADAEDADEDWGDEPAKPTKPTKPAKPSKNDDEADDWDI